MKLNNNNLPRKTDKDVFLAKKLANANFNTGFYQVPEINNFEIEKPEKLILWSSRHRCKNKNKCGLIFYEYDAKFDGKRGIYNILKYGTENQINKMINEIKEFSFVVCPDYSVYGNFPNYKQIDAMARSREVGYILTTYGIKVIVNFRALYEWTYELALTGICVNSIIAIGTLGTLKDKETKELLKNSVKAVINYVKPRCIIVYGFAPEEIFGEAKELGIKIWQYDSEIKAAFQKGDE